MNHSTITPVDITRGSAPTITPERKAFREQQDLTAELGRLYSLVETSRLAMQQINAEGGEAVADTLLLAAEKLFELVERQQVRCEQLEAIAYPDHNGGADHE